jgi:putative heme-binding domain-containing protein
MRTMLDDSSPQVRAAALTAAPTGRKYENLEVRVTTSIADGDPLVRKSAALRLGEVSHPYAIPALGRLFADPSSDPFLVAAAASSLTKRNVADVTKEALDRAALDKVSPATVIDALIDTAAGFDDRPALARLLVAALDATSGAERPHAISAFIDGLARHRLDLAKLATTDNAGLHSRVEELKAQLALLRRKADDRSLAVIERVAALGIFGREASARSEELAILGRLLAPQTPDVLQSTALETLARFDSAEAADLALARWATFAVDRKQQIVAACLDRASWTERLIAAVAEKRIAAAEVDVTGTQRLLAHPNKNIRAAAEKAFAAAVDPDRAALVAKYVSQVTAGGDAERGKALFTKSCGPCHLVGGVGRAVGPDLTALSDRTLAAMLTSLLDPNRAVESKYVAYTAVTDAGLTLIGLLVAETDATVTLASADGKQHVLRRDEIEEFVSTGRSFMPVGLEKEVSPDGASDLLAFLAGSRLPPKSFAGNTPRVVEPEALRGEFYLTAETGEGYGEMLDFIAGTPPRWTSWKSATDRVEWECEITVAGTYDVSIEYARAKSGSADFVVDCGGTRLRGQATSTGGSDQLRTAIVGQAQLGVGRRRVIVKSEGVPDGELFELLSVRLRRRG